MSIVVGGCVKRLVSYFISSVFDLGRCEYSCPGLIMRRAWLLSGEGLGLKFCHQVRFRQLGFTLKRRIISFSIKRMATLIFQAENVPDLLGICHPTLQ